MKGRGFALCFNACMSFLGFQGAGYLYLQDHPKFETVERLAPLLFSRELQTNEAKKPEAMSLGDAVSEKIIANQTLAYFIGRTYLFLVSPSPLQPAAS